jgi:DNA-binding response OmpR family regulator
MPTRSRPQTLVVASDQGLLERVVGWLSSEGHDTRICTDFESAKAAYDADPPDLLVTQLKLGAFNGLHLAMRARCQRQDASTIVIGKPDALFEEEAERHQAKYLPQPLDERQFSEIARALLLEPRDTCG